MNTTMNTSATIGAIAKALASAQAEIENVTKDAKNEFFKKSDGKASTYATLAAVLDECRPILAKNGIAIVQMPGNDGDLVTVTTTFMHADTGEFISSTAGVKPAKGDAQGFGAATTYLRRFTLAAMCGVAQEDDDGNAASARDSAPSRPANDRGATTPAPRTQSPVVGHSGKPATDDAKAKQDAARKEIRDAVAWMNIAHEERELLSMLDNLDVDDLRKEWKRIMDAKKAIQNTDLPL